MLLNFITENIGSNISTLSNIDTWVFWQVIEANWANWRNMTVNTVTQPLKKNWPYEQGNFKLSDLFTDAHNCFSYCGCKYFLFK